MYSKLSIKFYLNKQKPSRDGFKIYMRITYERNKAELATGFSCSKNEWKNERVIDKDHINKALSKLESNVYHVKDQLQYEEKDISARAIKQIITGEAEFNKRLIDYFSEHIEQIEALKNDYSEATVKTYKTSIRHLKNFLKFSNKKNIFLKNVDYQFIKNYDHYLRTKIKTRNHTLIDNNTVVKQHSKLRTIILKANREGYMKKNPYNDFPLRIIERKVKALTKDELEKIQNLKLPDRLDRVRDLFIFACFTGLRFGDADKLTMNEIQVTKGRYYLNLSMQQKTKDPLFKPMTKAAIKIIKKYSTSNDRIIHNKVLPKITNQNVNKYLKELAAIAEIHTNLTHKVSRHTFATTVLAGVSKELKKEFLGHKDIRSTDVYNEILEDEYNDVVDQVDKKFSGI